MTFPIERIIDLIERYPGWTVNDLVPHLTDLTRKQILKALHNAAHTNRLRCEREGGKGGGGGSKPGRYYVVPQAHKPKPPSIGRVSSVWDLGRVA